MPASNYRETDGLRDTMKKERKQFQCSLVSTAPENMLFDYSVKRAMR
jgi:hypothetical protein